MFPTLVIVMVRVREHRIEGNIGATSAFTIRCPFRRRHWAKEQARETMRQRLGGASMPVTV